MSEEQINKTPWRPFQEHILAAVFVHENQAIRTIEYLIEHDFLMDRISLLGPRLSKGDDFLGIYYPSPKVRMKKWAQWGAIIGALWGLVASLISTVASLEGTDQALLFETFLWTMTYSALVGALMAAAAAFSHVASMLHRMGIPEEQIEVLEQAIKAHKYVVLLIGSRRELEPFQHRIEHSGAERVLNFAKDRLEV
ncbi:hypothetical protein Tel_07405 [Candidatus Tenderia electrophaga]|jgi:hypothetical protein|uniref:DUF1269 domain-containing protein n=1 Tax=Candidatus Tenderia electrophaga TaxID=1748243 RepID=A0A0S2TCZ9_9GAMM|nr:hypothetical protein Tel_07405 [Candidatus Tenderia electrophaga]